MSTEPDVSLGIINGSPAMCVHRQGSNKGSERSAIACYQDGKSERRVLSDFAVAKKRTKVVASPLAKGGGAAVVSLRPEDRRAYLNAKRLIKPTRVTVEGACREYAEAFRLLGGVSVVAAAREYAKQHGTDVEPKMIREVVKEFLAAKEEGRSTRLRGTGRHVSERYLYQLRLRLDAFASVVKGLIGDVTAEAINDFVHGMTEVGGRTKNNYIEALHGLFEFARKKRHIPRDFAVMDEVDVAAEADFDIEILTPLEFKLLLANCPESLVPVLVIGAFAGLRSAEIHRLDWAEVRLKRGHIEVMARKSKTRARRLVPLVPALAAWLDKRHQGQGPVWPLSAPYLFELQRKTAQTAGFAWKHNALRHSFISYRVADIKNVDQVALEAGNSPDIIFQHYRELVTSESAMEWFGVTPDLVAAEAEQLKEEAATLRTIKNRS